MYQNTKLFSFRGLLIAALLSMVLLPNEEVYASEGTDLAKKMLQKIQTVSTEKDMNAFLQEASQEKSRLPTEDRIDYAEYLAYITASDTGNKGGEGGASWAAAMLIPGGISEQEIRDGEARLLSSNDSAIRACAENLDLAGSVKLSNGEMGQDISVFNLALHDPKVPQDLLIGALFKLAPAESAQWFADHAGLSANDRNALESELQLAWQMHRALNNEPGADKQSKAILRGSVKNPVLNRWLNSPSWILRSLANGLLQKHQEWQTPDLKKAMQPVQVPSGLQITPGQ